MGWHGDIAFGEAALVFYGDSADNRFHAHAAVQCVLSPHGVELIDETGQAHRGSGWIIRSGAEHCLRPVKALVLALIEPQSRLARSLLRYAGDGPIAAMPPELIELMSTAMSAADLMGVLQRYAGGPVEGVDRRVLSALSSLNDGEARDSAAAAARHAGISPSHLRALCRSEFGVPFSKLVLWRKVRRACMAMGAGLSLADAAAEAGFADQAHLTRTLTEVIGLTAGEAARASD